MRILIIDDQKETLDMLEEILRLHGFDVFTCSESHESLKILTENNISCVVTDLKMPILEGGDLIEVIKKNYPKTPIVVLSAHIESKSKILKKGAFAVLDKPVTPEELILTVQDAIAESTNEITFQFDHINLKQIKHSVNVRLIKIALKRTDGNQVKASKLLGISRQSLIRYLKLYKINQRELQTQAS